MREIKYIVIHCTATLQNATVESIKNYWKNSLKWKSPGYHFIVEQNGNVTQLSELSKPTNGVAGYNANSIHISYIGGIDMNNKPTDNRTEEQKESLITLVKRMKLQFKNAKVQGHRDFPSVKKACPCFNAKTEYLNI